MMIIKLLRRFACWFDGHEWVYLPHPYTDEENDETTGHCVCDYCGLTFIVLKEREWRVR